ncbi:enolase C-terminal domain-like protein [Solimonas terrae]|uniref:Dipeptide epimerase n=1 Tax=Solimonas terrae TaxID=1396819 RepID=A0A6M2BPS9_9GAMM|nr:enolase C-terminal domain-like protein [Solimonas terrae]NGY04089.1 dipeptide epimerase [Solimonas terrae]
MKRELVLGVERWPCRQPFRISGQTWTDAEVVVCEIREAGISGRGEAAGVYYRGEDAASLCSQIEAIGTQIRDGVERQALLELLPSGGARNAVDCALWDLQARRTARSVRDRLGIADAGVSTVFTIGLESTPQAMADKAGAASDRPNLKIKLDADRPVERVAAIRAARPDARLIADVNGGWSFQQLKAWAPALSELGLSLLEQPLPRGGDAELEGYDAPLPLFADESCLDLSELPLAAERYDGLVIKLDKAGGLTAALALAAQARARRMQLMVGCMVATSLAMAPAHVLASLCDFVDIDGPLLLASDRAIGLRYDGASVTVPHSGCWGTAD